MPRKNKRRPHEAIENVERPNIGRSPTEEQREEPFWPPGTERLYGDTPEYLPPGPEFDPQYRTESTSNDQPSPQRIRDDVSAVLTREPELEARDITVDVNDECDVTLGGKVSHQADKRLAEDLAADVRGVRDVHNNIRVAANL